MTSLILLSAISFNLIEIGVGMGTNTPIGNIERNFTAGALFSVQFGKEVGRGKFILSFENSTLSGNGQSTYELQMNGIGLKYGYYLFKGENWSLPLALGINHIWLSRKFEKLQENGMAQGVNIGIGFLEKIRRTGFGAEFFVTGLYGLAIPRNAAYMLGIKATFGYEL